MTTTMKTIGLTTLLLLIVSSTAVTPTPKGSSPTQSALNLPTGDMEDMESASMNMTGGLTIQQTNGNVTAAEDSGVSGNQTTIDANMTLNGVNLYVLAEVLMGFEHPRAWHVEHCRHVPYFPMPAEILGCVQATGWFYNMSSRSCELVSIPCNDLPTLNFWHTIFPCEANCTHKGKGIVFADAPMVNLDPRSICIIPALTGQSAKDCPASSGPITTTWTYDATAATCFEVQYDCHWQASNNTFVFNSTCQHFCHDVSFPNISTGHHLFLNGTNTNQTINGVSVNVQQSLHLGWINLTIPWDINHCRKIPFFNTTREIKTCVNSTGFFYNTTTRTCQTVTVPCGDIPTQNFFPDQATCQAQCSNWQEEAVSFAGAPNANLDPRIVCSMPVYTNARGNCTDMQIDWVETVWTYDPVMLSCDQVTVVCSHALTLNAFLDSGTCTNFCGGVSASNVSFGFHPLPGQTITPVLTTITINGMSTVGA